MEYAGIFTGLVLGWLSFTLVLTIYLVGRKWWNHHRFGAAIDHGHLLVLYGRQLARAPDRTTVSRLLTEDIPAELGVKESSLLLPKDHQLISTTKGGINLPINHAAVRWVTSSGEAQHSDKGRLAEVIGQGRADLLWTRVWVPLMRGIQLGGIWLIGERESGVFFSSEDLQWLTSIAREAASVLEAMDFTEQERQSASEMRTLYRQMIAARETERGRLSRELHDGVLQDMCAIARDLKALRQKTEPEDDKAFDDLIDHSGSTVNALRAICNDLRPPLLVQDLASALKTLAEEMDTRSHAPIHIEVSTQKNELHLADDAALAFFRITQEALNNAIQHADASEIAVRLTEYPGMLRLTVTDDGQGIPGNLYPATFVANGHYGIAGMRERAAMIGGKLEIQSSQGYGTVVILELPSRLFRNK
ncbi:MAG: sensor histidine kinase [Anaerolineales bacterium]|jgi:signal transduction histidine kinase